MKSLDGCYNELHKNNLKWRTKMNKLISVIVLISVFFGIVYTINPVSAGLVYDSLAFDADPEVDEIEGIAVDGSYLWVVDPFLSGYVFRYNIGDGSYSSFSFGLQSGYPSDIAVDGTYIWVLDEYTNLVYKYNYAGVYQGVSLSLPGLLGNPYGICMNSTYFWITDHYGSPPYSKVRQYNFDGTSTGFSFSLPSGYTGGITMDENYFWVIDYSSDNVHQYTHDGTLITSTSIVAQCTNGLGITKDSNYFWVADRDGEVFKYTYNNIPTVPTLVSPAHLSGHISMPITLDVSSTDGDSDTITYYFYGGTSPTPTTFIGNNDSVGDSSFDWSVSEYDVYYWRARAYDGYEYSDYMSDKQFTFYNPTPAPVNIANTTGYFWIHWTFQEGSGIADTDSYNISVTDKGWTNGSANLFYNATDLDFDTEYTINVYAYNNTYGLNSTSLSDTMTSPDYPPPAVPINIINTTGNFWIHWIFQEGTGLTSVDSYNISVSDEGWTNGSTNLFRNATSLDPNTAYTINIYAYNDTWGLSGSSLTDTMTVPNNAPVLTDISSTYELYETAIFSLDANFTDLDGGSVTFTDNSFEWDINSATGLVLWDDITYIDVGVHYYRITIDDGFGGSDYIDFTVTINGNQNTVLNSVDSIFDNALAGSDFTENEIPLSFSLTNSGSLDAIVTAEFITDYSGTYGLISGTTIIDGTNFKIGNVTFDAMTSTGNPVTLTNGVPKENTQINYGVQVKIPTAQDALTYAGVIELTFSTS